MTDPVSVRPEAATMVRALGVLYLAGTTVAAIVLLLSGPSGRDEAGIWVLVVLAAAMAPVVYTQYGRLPPAAVSAVIAFANCLITMVVLFDHDVSSPASFFYLWVTPYAIVFFSPWHAAGHVAFVAVAYATVLLILDGEGDGSGAMAHFLHTMAALVVTVLLVRTIERTLRASLAAIDEERRRRALEINDDVVQRLVLARQCHADGEADACDAEVDAALERARAIMAELIVADGLVPGGLRRQAAANGSD